MSLKKIIRKNIEDNAVTEPKLANEAVTAEKLSTDFVTGLTELSEQAANDDILLIYDASAGALKKVSKSNTTVLETPVVSSVSPTSVVSDAGLSTFTITGTGFTAGSNARLIGSNGKKIDFTTVTRNSSTQITATINVTTDLLEAETPYSVQVIDGNGIADLLTDQIDIDQYPVFVTASGSLGSSRFSMSGVEVNATDPDSAAPVTFELQSGSLPPGISITNTGANGGTATFTGTITPQSSDTVYNFTLRAVDAASNTSSRSFSFTALGPQIESFTSSGTFTAPTGLTTVDVLIVAGGGGGSSHHGGGGGAGGLIFMPNYPVTPGSTIPVTVGCGGAGGYRPSPLAQGSRGQDSVFGTLTAKGGGGGTTDTYLQTTPGNATELQSGGSGGGTGYQNQSQGGPATQPTQPGNSGAYGFGNNGGYGSNYNGNSASGGGGGGAGSTGSNAGLPSTSGVGGNGKSYTIADGTTPVYYAGGGGGGTGGLNPANGGPGGQGGGGAGGAAGTNNGQSGQANKGGGGGGGTTSTCSGTSGGTGGKGIVIVKY